MQNNKNFLPVGKKRIISKNVIVKLFLFSVICFYFLPAKTQNQYIPVNCNTPLVGEGRIVNHVSDNLISVLSNFPAALNNLVDGDLSNYATFQTPALVGNVPLISIKDVLHYYPANVRTGFVVQTSGAALNLSLMNGFIIRTYRNGVVQEIITTSNSTLSIELIGNSQGKRRISFITALPFDEIELVQTSLSSLITSINIYYAFVEPVSGCDYNCITPVNTMNFPGAAASSSISGLCLGCSVSNLNNVLDASLTNYASMNTVVGFVATINLNVKAGEVIPAGSDAGFVLTTAGGLLDASLLQNTKISTYLSGTLQESQNFGGIADISLLAGNLQALSFKTTKNFDEIQISEPTAIALATTYRIYYAFIRRDSDNDGFPNCVDRCPTGPDYYDANGNGIPDACDNSCNLNAGADFYLCPDETSYDFDNLGLEDNLTWNILDISESGASINSQGLVTGMLQPGKYYVEVGNTEECYDTVIITKRDPLANFTCNIPLIGPEMEIFDPSGGNCLLCINSGTSGNPDNVIDGDLSNYIVSNSLVSILNSTPVIGVHNKIKTYPAGTRTGFVVKNMDGLLDVDILSSFSIRTYLQGVEQETISGNFLMLSTGLLGTDNKLQRIGFVSSLPFDAVVLYVNSGISISSGLRVYYAFEESGSECDNNVADDCVQMLKAGDATLEMSRTGFFGIACVNCSLTNLGNLIDEEDDNYAVISQSIGLESIASVSIKSGQLFTNKYQAGFIIASPGGLLNISALSGITIQTYNNGVLVDNYIANSSLVGLEIIDQSSGKMMIVFQPTASFNEIRLTVTATIGVLQTIHVYGAFVRKDSDGDGVPDCMDKCCKGPDYIMDPDAPGIPSACSMEAIADAACVSYPVTISITENNLSGEYSYALYEGDTQIGIFSSDELSFIPATSGPVLYTIKASLNGSDYVPVKDLHLVIYSKALTWSPVSSQDTVWSDNLNWTPDLPDTGPGSSPYWCTDVTIPGDAVSFPTLEEGDQCRDIYFKNNASAGKIIYLKYRHAYVEFKPNRNSWVMISAPLKYMYSADYGADYSWSSAISPKVFMRHFDVEYKTTGKINPDGVAGTSNGNFSRAFAYLEENLESAQGFAIWINGQPYADSDFPASAPYNFPRRDQENDDVLYSYHDINGNWVGDPFYIEERGNNIKNEEEWTATSVPDGNNRYRFIYEDLLDSNREFQVPITTGSTIIVGNPFMSHLDFVRFYNDNTERIYNYYRIWNGEQFYSYVYLEGSQVWSGLEGLSSSGETTISQYISPMQAFFVETNPDSPSSVLRFTPESSVAKTGSTLRNLSTEESHILRISVQAENKKSYGIVAALPGVSNGYLAGEDVYKLFSPYDEFPEIYTVADENAIEINAVNIDNDHLIPIGIKTNMTGPMELNIKGSDSFSSYDEVKIIDLEKNTEHDLDKADTTILFEKSNTENLEGRFYVALKRYSATNKDITDNKKCSISIFVNEKTITISSVEEEIKAIRIYNLEGKLKYSKENVNNNYQQFYFQEKGIFLLQIKTNYNVKNYKLIL